MRPDRAAWHVDKYSIMAGSCLVHDGPLAYSKFVNVPSGASGVIL